MASVEAITLNLFQQAFFQTRQSTSAISFNFFHKVIFFYIVHHLSYPTSLLPKSIYKQ